ncbi:hypothetical protein AVEN_85962-1 [Araneus ventricosus]|uniref:Uncharacterized protein n=1 Tax=Araneus ventricosus TaxID=182803 RepID=A0A4Y2G7G3_ARAVE|nr:hypothetical protein AVEN_85962-1 [Araneus ventricosus]
MGPDPRKLSSNSGLWRSQRWGLIMEFPNITLLTANNWEQWKYEFYYFIMEPGSLLKNPRRNQQEHHGKIPRRNQQEHHGKIPRRKYPKR